MRVQPEYQKLESIQNTNNTFLKEDSTSEEQNGFQFRPDQQSKFGIMSNKGYSEADLHHQMSVQTYYDQSLRSVSPGKTITLDSGKKKNIQDIYNNFHKQNSEIRSQILQLSSQEVLYFFQNYTAFNTEILPLQEIKQNPSLKIKKYKTSFFYGVFLNHKRHGKGIMVYHTGRVYEGDWENDLKHGRGFELFPNESYFVGQYLNGKPEGMGTYIYTNGEIYEGQWINGLKHGSGIWKGNKGDSYIGEWRFGKADGYGVHTWLNGDKYEGQFRYCLKHGEGTEKFSNGDTYVGHYVNGKPDGYGEYYWGNGSSFKGYFKNGLRHGHGIWKRSNNEHCDQYEGEYQNDKKNGYGRYQWQSGNVYLGHYFDDLRHGFGEMRWIDGSYYKGMWERGIQHGEGEMYMPGEQTLKGIFEQNVFMGNSIEEQQTLPSINDIKQLSNTMQGRFQNRLSRRNISEVRDPKNRKEVDETNFPELNKSAQYRSPRKIFNTSYSSLSQNKNNVSAFLPQTSRTTIDRKKLSLPQNSKLLQQTQIRKTFNNTTRNLVGRTSPKLQKTVYTSPTPRPKLTKEPVKQQRSISYSRNAGTSKNYLQLTHCRWRAISENCEQFKRRMINCLCCNQPTCVKKDHKSPLRNNNLSPLQKKNSIN